jgi:hypothetical protein
MAERRSGEDRRERPARAGRVVTGTCTGTSAGREPGGRQGTQTGRPEYA